MEGLTLNGAGQVKGRAFLAFKDTHAMRGRARSAGDFIISNHSDSAPVGCTSSTFPNENDDCSSTEPPSDIFPSVSWVEQLEDVEAKASTSLGVTKSLMKCPYSRKRLKCRRGMLRSAAVTRLCELDRTTTKKNSRKPGKNSSEDDHPPCFPYIIIG